MGEAPFSRRHGLSGPPPGTLIREDAPNSVRTKLLDVLVSLKLNSLGHDFGGVKLRDLVCQVVNVQPKLENSGGDLAFVEAKQLIYECEWFHFYDIVEELSRLLRKEDGQGRLPPKNVLFADAMNEGFVKWGIGWLLDYNGDVVTRGDEAFEHTNKVAERELTERQTTRTRIREAIDCLSRRPEPDLSGAISHAFAAMESIIGDIEYTAEEVRDSTNHTFGTFLQRHPDLFPSEDLKAGFQHLWKYANNEGSRHGKEGVEPERDEAEFIVSVAASLVTYLNRKHPK
jgi:AbiJ-like protein